MNVAIMCNTKSSEYPNRPELIESLVHREHKIFFGVIDDGKDNEYFINHDSVSCLKIVATRNNTNPIKELKSLLDVKQKVRECKIDCSIVYGVKNHAAMAIGSKLGRVKKVICVVNGRGNLFTTKGIKGMVLRFISYPMLFFAYKLSSHVCFQNPDDASFFIQKRLVSQKKAILMNGSGVNTKLFPKCEMPNENRFLYMARITPSKGLKEFIEAARIVRDNVPNAIFDIVGPIDDLIEGSCEAIVRKAEAEGIVNYHGRTEDVQKWLKSSRFFVYPSYYPEGVPRCVLQAMATGRPVVTCNSSGCKETVIDKYNGRLVDPKDVLGLSEAMIYLVRNPLEAIKMGENSRKLAMEKFDIDRVNNQLMHLVEGET